MVSTNLYCNRREGAHCLKMLISDAVVCIDNYMWVWGLTPRKILNFGGKIGYFRALSFTFFISTDTFHSNPNLRRFLPCLHLNYGSWTSLFLSHKLRRYPSFLRMVDNTVSFQHQRQIVQSRTLMHNISTNIGLILKGLSEYCVVTVRWS